jgi:ATP-binding protein involved in chromosome partitioning
MLVTREQLEEKLKGVNYPGFNRDIVSFGMVKSIEINGDLVTLGLKVSTRDEAVKTQIFEEAIDACLAAGAGRIEIDDLAPSEEAPGQAPPQPQGFEQQRIPGVKRIFAVASGKGGVGKSMVAVNLTEALAMKGHKVGLLDADVYGPSLPTMFGVREKPVAGADGKIIPIQVGPVKVMSIGLLLDEDAPAIWRGPMVMQVLQQFLHQVAWGQLDALIVDLPPGTGDAQLTMVQQVPLSGGIIVTTPQEVALADVRRGIRMFRETEVPVLGVIENMAFYTCPCCGNEDEIFSRGGGQRSAERYGVPFLGEIPIDPRIRKASDEGEPFVRRFPDAPASQAFLTLADNLIAAAELLEAHG